MKFEMKCVSVRLDMVESGTFADISFATEDEKIFMEFRAQLDPNSETPKPGDQFHIVVTKKMILPVEPVLPESGAV